MYVCMYVWSELYDTILKQTCHSAGATMPWRRQKPSETRMQDIFKLTQ